MNLFDGMLKDGESLFKNDVALSFDYQPKLLQYREKEQFQIASIIKPLFQKRSGKNMLVYGSPGIGKTVAIKHILNELEEQTDEIIPLYINCWQKNTTYKIVTEMCDLIGYKFTQNKKTEELFKIVIDKLNSYGVVFVFDEFDKAEEINFLYSILEEVYRKSIILISNYKDDVLQLDERIYSRLMPMMLEFMSYNKQEIRGILDKRKEWAFIPDCWNDDAFDMIVEKTYEGNDIRVGLHLLKQSGEIAEEKSSRKITAEIVFTLVEIIKLKVNKDSSVLQEDEQKILFIIKKNTGQKIGDIFEEYKKDGGSSAYRTFQRRIDKLAQGGFISIEKVSGGKEGKTTLIQFQKTLDEFQ